MYLGPFGVTRQQCPTQFLHFFKTINIGITDNKAESHFYV